MIRTALLLIACCGSALASDQAIRETARRSGLSVAEVQTAIKRCDESQFTLNLCANYEFIKTDIELNQEYAKLIARKDERNVEQLKRAQRVWVQLRDLGCVYESSDLEGGSLRPTVKLACMRRMTDERIGWIREMLSCTSVAGECRSASRARK